MDDRHGATTAGKTDGPITPGRMIADKFRVERIIGNGGMGVVVAARHIELDELRAVKLMHPKLAENRELVRRFLREARACVRLRNEHVVKVFDVWRLKSGVPYIVMEYLEGIDFRRLLRQRTVLSVREAITYVLQACEAIAEAHALAIIHRDLKPANLFLTTSANGSPCVKVLDFGISKVAIDDPLGQGGELTRATDVIGTPSYMAPEQIRSARDADPRSDIWSIGVILYEFVTGRRPFMAAGELGTIAVVLEGDPAPASVLRPDLPHALEAIIHRCLEKSPQRRFASVDALAGELRLLARCEWPEPEVDTCARCGMPSSRGRTAAAGMSSASRSECAERGPASSRPTVAARRAADPLPPAAPEQAEATKVPASRTWIVDAHPSLPRRRALLAAAALAGAAALGFTLARLPRNANAITEPPAGPTFVESGKLQGPPMAAGHVERTPHVEKRALPISSEASPPPARAAITLPAPRTATTPAVDRRPAVSSAPEPGPSAPASATAATAPAPPVEQHSQHANDVVDPWGTHPLPPIEVRPAPSDTGETSGPP